MKTQSYEEDGEEYFLKSAPLVHHPLFESNGTGKQEEKEEEEYNADDEEEEEIAREEEKE